MGSESREHNRSRKLNTYHRLGDEYHRNLKPSRTLPPSGAGFGAYPDQPTAGFASTALRTGMTRVTGEAGKQPPRPTSA